MPQATPRPHSGPTRTTGPGALVSLMRLLRIGRGSTLALIGLGLLASAFEGIGLYTLVPLLTIATQADPDVGGLPATLIALFPDPQSGWLVPALAGFFLLCVLLKNVVHFLNVRAFALVNCRAGHELRTRLYRDLLSAGIGPVEADGASAISTAMLAESWRAVEALGAFFRMIVPACAAVVLFAVMLLISWQGALLILPIGLVFVGILEVIGRRTLRLGQETVDANERFIRHFRETVAGLRTIRVFGAAQREQARFSDISRRVMTVFARLQIAQNIPGPAFEVLAALALTFWLVFMFGIGSDIEEIAVFLVVLYRLQAQVRMISQARAQLLSLAASVEAIDAVGRACAASALPEGARDFTGGFRAIRFERVGHTYPARDTPVLSEIDLCLPRHSVSVLAGPSGVGKSTLVSLLCREMDPTCGRILVDGVDLRDFRLSSWLARVGYVPQHIHLFAASVAENIRYGQPDATDEEVRAAAVAAHCHAFIQSLPGGYDTEVGSNGLQLSGGQRQRIALARALVRKPELLILDEATNALDPESEAAIRAALQHLSGEMTMLIIAHDRRTLDWVDRVLVLSPGGLSLCEG